MLPEGDGPDVNANSGAPLFVTTFALKESVQELPDLNISLIVPSLTKILPPFNERNLPWELTYEYLPVFVIMSNE